jgi:regulatory protein YycI of two-component signal transduction system YycFG
MFYKYKNIWNKWDFEIVIFLCMLFLLLLFIYRKLNGKKGTWSKNNIYDNLNKLNSSFNINNFNSSLNKINLKQNNDSKGEKECRRVLEEIFNKPFPKSRPNILNNPVTGGLYNLELDCYNEELKIACEYNGIQHYKFIPFFHKNKETYYNQAYRDELKRRMCKDAGIHLIEVPYNISNIKKYIIDKLLFI